MGDGGYKLRRRASVVFVETGEKMFCFSLAACVGGDLGGNSRRKHFFVTSFYFFFVLGDSQEVQKCGEATIHNTDS